MSWPLLERKVKSRITSFCTISYSREYCGLSSGANGSKITLPTNVALLNYSCGDVAISRGRVSNETSLASALLNTHTNGSTNGARVLVVEREYLR